jgi:hypothetical protein
MNRHSKPLACPATPLRWRQPARRSTPATLRLNTPSSGAFPRGTMRLEAWQQPKARATRMRPLRPQLLEYIPNRRSGIRPGQGDGSGIPEVDRLPSQAYRLPKRSVLILRAVLAAGRRRPVSASERPQAFRAQAPSGSASVPARESLALVRPVGPGLSFSSRDPASPGVACSTLVPRRALLAGRGRSGTRHPSQYPRLSASS